MTDPTPVRRRRMVAATTLLGVGALLMLQAAFATQSAAQEAPPGNNATVKIVDTDIDSLDDANSANHPHVACDFSLRWYGFDEGTRTTSVSYEAQDPSGTGAVAAITGRSSFTFDSPGGGGVLDFSEPYRLDTTGLVEQENQGFHVKVTVTTDGSQGNDTKSKVFWLGGCPAETESPTPSPSPSSETPTPTPSESASVLPTELTQSPTITPSVLGVKIVKGLPFTGTSHTSALVATGVALVLAGSALLLPRRRGLHQQ